MTDVKTYIVALLIIGIVRWLIPKFGKLVNWLIIKSVKLAERLIRGSKLGDKKKAFVLKLLRIFGIRANETINEIIELAVDALNNKQSDTVDNIKSDVNDGVSGTIDKVTNK